MSNLRRKLLHRVSRCGRPQPARQLKLEALERRDCPAVQAILMQGVLSFIGDDGPNAIEIVCRSDGRVQAVGDGMRHTFEGVRELSVNTGAGNDTASVSLPSVTDLVIDPFDARIDLGSGNDRLTIADGGPSRRRLVTNASMDLQVDLGTGADKFVMQVNQHDEVELDLTSGDGGDRILVGMLLPAVQKVREAAARMNLNLGGGQNEISVNTKEVGQVELNLAAQGGGNSVQYGGDDGYRDVYMDEPFPPWCKLELGFAGGGNVVDVNTQGFDEMELEVRALSGENVVEINEGWGPWEINPARILNQDSTSRTNLNLAGGGNQVGVNTRGYDAVGLDLELTGNNNQVAIALLLPAVQKAHPCTECRRSEVSATLDFTGEHNRLEASIDGFDKVELSSIVAHSRESEAGGSYVKGAFAQDLGGNVQAGQPIPTGSVTFAVDTDLPAPGGVGDVITIQGTGFGAVSVDANTAGGNDSIWIDIAAPVLRSVEVGVNTGAGDDVVYVGSANGGVWKTQDAGASWRIETADGNDLVQVVSDGLPEADLDLRTGNGDDIVEVRSNVFAIWPTTGFNSDIDLGLGDDRLSVDTRNHCAVHSVISTGDGNDEVTVAHKQKNWPVANFKFGAIPAGSLDLSVDAAIDLGPGDDALVFETDGIGQVGLDLKAGEGNDTAVVGLQDGLSNTILFGEWYGLIDVELGAGNDDFKLDTRDLGPIELDVTAGDGDDTVAADAFYGRGVLKSTDGGSTWNVDLGDGDDLADIKSQGFARSSLDLTAGAGNDSVKFKPLFAFIVVDLDSPAQLDISANLGDGDDRLEIDANGYGDVDSFIDAGAGHDLASNRLYVGNLSFESQNTSLHAVTLLGTGDDRLEFDTSGYAEAESLIDAGDGNDAAQIRHRMFAIVDRTKFNVTVMLGKGSDTLALETAGYREVRTKFDTGPAGDGRDTASARHDALRRPARRDVRRVALDGGMDAYEHVALGYTVQVLAESLISTEYLFVA